MRRWFKRRGGAESIKADADAWMARHGVYCYELAGQRALDAYLVGNLIEQERWNAIRREILERVEPGAAFEDVTEILKRRRLQASETLKQGENS